MQEKASYVIIGNGITGVTAAEILRAEDAAADITVVADDPFPVYYRPALKDYLAGRVREDKLWARPNSFYQAQRIRFLSERVVGIQAGQHSIQLQNGKQLAYSRLLLANGARANRLTCPGANLPGVMTLRTVADYQEVVARLRFRGWLVGEMQIALGVAPFVDARTQREQRRQRARSGHECPSGAARRP